MKTLLATAAVALSLMSGTATATTISTLGNENSSIFNWGLPNTAAYGQTFTLGAAATLNTVSFRIDDVGTATTYIAYVFAWGGNLTVGSALASVVGSTVGSAGMQTVTVDLGDVAVGAGQYVAFLQATSPGLALWGSVFGDVYAGGGFVFQNNGGDETQFGTVNWQLNWQGPGYDLAFALTYDEVAPIPVPAALPLMLLALGGLGLVARRRRAAA